MNEREYINGLLPIFMLAVGWYATGDFWAGAGMALGALAITWLGECFFEKVEEQFYNTRDAINSLLRGGK